MKKIIVFLTLIIFYLIVQAQTSIPRAQSMFIYNFSRLIEWPGSYKSGVFKIGILGSGDVVDELVDYTRGKRVGAQTIQVNTFQNPSEITKCHILFVVYGKTNKIPEVVSQIGSNSTLLIAEKRGATNDGAAVNFLIVSNSLKFELKPSNATKQGLKLNPKLSEMAMKVY
jgi:hypothetical protein